MSQEQENNKQQINLEELPEEVRKVVEELQKDKANLTSEIKDIRTKKQEAEAAAIAVQAKKEEEAKAPESNQFDPDKAVEEALAKREADALLRYRQEAEQNFRQTVSDLNPDNDAGDIKFTSFKNTLSKFNLGAASSKEEIDGLLKDAYTFWKQKSASQQSSLNNFAGTKPSGYVAPDDSADGMLSPLETKLIAEKGWTKEKYLKLKSSQGAFISQLLNQ